ncbi:hypothetical protein HTZ85_10550 [Escherichia coli]|nr:hypothetical protein [Escherichia coli]
MKHKRRQLRPAAEETDDIRQGLHDGAETSTAADGQTKAEVPLTTEAVITRENLMLAYQRVAELKPSLKKNRPSVRQALTDGNYQPRAIRRMDIPKPDGGVRTLGIPTVLDRLIQQAIAQQLSAIVDKSFLRLQLRLPAGAQRMAGGATGTALHTERQTVGGGYGSGEVL